MSRLNNILTIDKILQSTSGGRDIFEREIGKIGKKCINSPLRNDKNPSFGIFLANNGLWMYKDFSNGDSGTAIKFLQLRYNLDFKGVIDYIQNNNIVISNSPVHIPKKEKKQELIIDWVDQKFTDLHKRYFDEYELDETFLNSRDIYALKTLAINKNVQKIPDNQYRFVYYAKDIDCIKILTLGESVLKSEKWKSFGIKNDYLWDYWRYKDSKCDNLMIVKSNKDSAVLAKLGYCAISTQNESSASLIKNKEKIELICEKPIIVFGSDVQGSTESIKANEVLHWRYFNTKKKYLHKYEVNDVAGLIKLYNSKKLINELKEKGL